MVKLYDNEEDNYILNLNYDLFKANEILTKDEVFIKCIKDFKSRPQYFKDLIQEAFLESKVFSHDNLIKVKNQIIVNNNLYLIY